MELDQILQLIEKVSDSSLTAFDYEANGVKITMEHGKAEPVQIISEPSMQPKVEKAPEKTEEKEGVFVTSPLVGTFYAAPAEDAEPFVKAGDTVKKGQVVAIVEAMKLMNEIESEVDGVIAEVLVKNGEMVDYGKPLFRVKA